MKFFALCLSAVYYGYVTQYVFYSMCHRKGKSGTCLSNLVLISVELARSQWSRSLRRRSAAACLPRLRLRIPPVYGCLSLVIVVCYRVEVSASGWSLFQRSRIECGVSECNRQPSIMRRPWPTRRCCAMGKIKVDKIVLCISYAMDNYGCFLTLKSRQIFTFIALNKTLSLPKLNP